MADDLAQGRVIAYRLVTVDEDPAGGPLSGPYSIDVYPASEPVNDVVETDADGRPVTIAYWVDNPVAGLRVLDPDELSSGISAAVGSLRSADVPQAPATVLFRGPPAQTVYTAGALLLLASTLVVIFGPRPRRGTRWFWFWLVGGPFAVGVPVFAVAELLRPRYEARGHGAPPGGRRAAERPRGVRHRHPPLRRREVRPDDPHRAVADLVPPRLTPRRLDGRPPDFSGCRVPA